MKNLFQELFVWWHGQTLGTRFYTWRKGEFVGEDEAGNRYYCEKDGHRRWVIYNGYADASKIPPGWHGWMHYRTDVPPTDEEYQAKEWQLPHQENLTGSAGAYLPKGSLATPEKRPRVTGDYDAWTP